MMLEIDCYTLCYIRNTIFIHENIYKHESKTNEHNNKKKKSTWILFTCEPAAALLIRLLLGWAIQKVETALQGIFKRWFKYSSWKILPTKNYPPNIKVLDHHTWVLLSANYSHTVSGRHGDVISKHFFPHGGAHGVVPVSGEEGAGLGEESQIVEQSISLFNTIFQKETMT